MDYYDEPLWEAKGSHIYIGPTKIVDCDKPSRANEIVKAIKSRGRLEAQNQRLSEILGKLMTSLGRKNLAQEDVKEAADSLIKLEGSLSNG